MELGYTIIPYGRIILKCILQRGVDYVHRASETMKWQAVVNTVMNFLIPQNSGNFLTYLIKMIPLHGTN
jgi:hypothetical protein